MHNFFRENNDRFIPVSCDDIKRIEKNFGIIFPDVLRRYYLEHNGKYIHTIDIPKSNDDEMGDIADIAEIIPLIDCNSEINVEYIKEQEMNEPNDPFIKRLRVKKNLIPLAFNECGDIYYWDSNDGKVYICFSADEDENGMEIPYYVCSSVEKMFELMDEAYAKENKG